ARAARDVGVRVGFAVALKDRNPLVYGPSDPVFATLPPPMRATLAERLIKPAMPVAEQIALVDAVADAAGTPEFDVQYGPTGVQWCSPELLAAVALASERTGRRVHMHCLETRYQRDWADRSFPDGMLRYLDGIGLLTPRLTLAHCTHARPDELDLLAARGVTIAVNTSSNLGIRSGIAPVADMIARGCRVALGIDGLALDEDDDALREMRLLTLLHGGVGFDTDATRPDILRMALHHGRAAVTNRTADAGLSAGSAADLLVINWDRVDDDRLRDDLDPLDLLFARARAEHVHSLWVGGRQIVAGGRVLGIDLPGLHEDLRLRTRDALGREADFMGALRALEPQLQQHYAAAPCC
ncbi:MAG: amidohydrolase family protein, partial [Janthinobacterium lividum]